MRAPEGADAVGIHADNECGMGACVRADADQAEKVNSVAGVPWGSRQAGRHGTGSGTVISLLITSARMTLI